MDQSSIDALRTNPVAAFSHYGIPQIAAPGCYDLVDTVGWQLLPEKWAEYPRHEHNRLLTSIVLNNEERRAVARAHSERLARATGPVVLLMPQHGLGEWDREGADLHDKEGLESFIPEIESTVPENIEVQRIGGHINDAAFAEEALRVFDEWCASGIVESVARD